MEMQLVIPNSFVRQLAAEIAREMAKKPCPCKAKEEEGGMSEKEKQKLHAACIAQRNTQKEAQKALSEKKEPKAEPKAEPKEETSCAITLEQMMHAAKEAARRIGSGGPVQELIKAHAEGEGKLKDVPTENYVKLLEALDELVTKGAD